MRSEPIWIKFFFGSTRLNYLESITYKIRIERTRPKILKPKDLNVKYSSHKT
jgi:hypothetical protein